MAEDNELEIDKDKLEKAEVGKGVQLAELPREVEIPQHNGHDTLDEAESGSGKQTDMALALKRLFPYVTMPTINQITERLLNSMFQMAMVSDISADIFYHMHHLTVNSIILDLDAMDEEINVQLIINLVYYILSIGLLRKGRGDLLEAIGSVKESEELKKVSESMFGS